MQSWGANSRFARRETRTAPTKSGVLGLLAAADGRRRTDPIEDLADLRFGVRVDQPGQLLRDFHTAINWATGRSMPLSERYYLADAVFLAAVEGEEALLEGLSERLDNPRFPLYLGRRSCPTEGRVNLGLRDGPLEASLRAEPWHSSQWYRGKRGRQVELALYLDADRDSDGPTETLRDVPLSFSPERREYGWREIVHTSTPMENPAGREEPDFFGALGGV